MNTLEMIKEAGVIGAGGAGFPTHVKLNAKADYLLLNGAECEPLLRVDQQLMARHPEEVLAGLAAAQEITGAGKVIIGIKESHPDVIRIMKDAIRAAGLADTFSVGTLPNVYPAGDEQVLVYELTGRIVPETSIPISVGCVVINAETAANVYRAVSGIPVTLKYVTVTGDVPNPVTLKVPVGTPLQLLFEYAGRTDLTGYEVINGGPMMGPLLTPQDKYVTKKTKGLIVLPGDHRLVMLKKRSMSSARKLNRSACEQCSICTDLCPRHLLGHSTAPHKMVRAMAYGMPASEKTATALTCCQCNLCEYYSCPAGIQPKMANVYYMGLDREAGIKKAPLPEYRAVPQREMRMVPSARLIERLRLREYNVPAPLIEEKVVIPDYVGIGLHDHVGAPAVPAVREGDRVSRGQKIAEPPEGALGCPVCSSIDGTVEAIDGGNIIIRRA
ncbi:MAG: 4Fe-4S dicluster domain-containing protein [Lachnospiraceae bacterium]|nr:4Fe-4S dicluster domain-containing protein [Lachnospiraceae bacterium]